MSGRQVVKKQVLLDRIGYQLVVDLTSSAYGGTMDEEHPGLRYATEVVRVLGAQYSYAFIGIPVNTFGYEHAPAVALQMDGPAGQVKLRARARVKMIDYTGQSIPLLCGSIVQYAHSIDEDSVIGMVMDDRWLLSKVTIFGCAIYDPNSKTFFFDAGRPCIFNCQGYPDCIDSNHGPVFAPGRLFGYKPSEAIESNTEPKSGGAQLRARSWTCHDIATYLRNMYYSAHRPAHPMNYGKQQLSQYIDWPSSFGSQYGFTRIPRHFELENLDCSEALSRLAKKAGPYELLMSPNGWRGRMDLVQVNSRKTSTYLTGPTYGSKVVGGDIAAALDDATRVSGGTVTESIVGYFDDVCIAGDPPAVEHQFQMYNDDDGEAIVELEAAWGIDEEDSFKKIIDDNGNDEAAFQMACTAEPRVYCAYRVTAGYLAYMNTHWPNDPQPFNPRILPQLLSGYAQGNSNPRDWAPREIVLEWYDASYGQKRWKACTRFDNLELIDDGTAFRVEALRNASSAAADRVTFTSSGYDTTTFVANPIRLTCAVEREFRITGKDRTDPNRADARINQVERFTYLAVGAKGDYSHWERYGSRPNGNNVIEPQLSQLFPDRCETAGGYLFSDLLQDDSQGTRIERHAKHRNEDVKRIDYHGILTMHTWNPGLAPGMMVQLDIGGKSIKPRGVIRCVKFNSQSQSQEIELMAGDNTTIYDVPLPSPGQTSGGSPAPSGGTTPKSAPVTGTDNYKENVDNSYNETSKTMTNNNAPYDEKATQGTPPNPSKPDGRSDKAKQKNYADDVMNVFKENDREDAYVAAEKKEAERVRPKGAEEMSKGMTEEEALSKYSSKAADNKRAADKKTKADTKEENIMKKALNKSVKRPQDADETE